jgi:queuine tRNA-ribosyltransferase
MFKIKNKDKKTKARTGVLKTNHDVINTPFFMPVVTKGAGKYITFKDLKEMDYECFISNAYLLYLKPGLNILEETKGYHNFISWNKSIFTDSGGFQLLDPSFLRSINDKGVHFRSPFNGDKHFISPEKLINIQNNIGSDVAMVLDHLLGPNESYQLHIKATNRTIDWANKCYNNHNNKKQKIFGIVQGGLFKDLRNICAKEINKIEFDGVAVGGLAIGESKENMYKAIDYSLEKIDDHKIKYLMGVGSPEDIVISIGKGIDCFDSIYPTKMARHGVVFTNKGPLKIWKQKYKNIHKPLDKNCNCYTCKTHTISYLHHLYRLKEPNVKILLSIHNLSFIQDLIKKARQKIKEETYDNFTKNFLKNYKPLD